MNQFLYTKIISGNFENFEKTDAYQLLGDNLFRKKIYESSLKYIPMQLNSNLTF